MYFIPRNNKLYAWAAHIQPVYRYITTSCIVTLIIVSWYNGIYVPVEKLLFCHKQERYAMQEQYLLNRKQLLTDSAIEQSIQELRTSLQTYEVKIDGSGLVCDLLDVVLHHVQDGGLMLYSYNSEQERQKKWYLTTDATFAFSGTYQQFLDAINLLQKDHLLMRIKQLSLTRMAQEDFKMSCVFSFLTIQ